MLNRIIIDAYGDFYLYRTNMEWWDYNNYVNIETTPLLKILYGDLET